MDTLYVLNIFRHIGGFSYYMCKELAYPNTIWCIWRRKWDFYVIDGVYLPNTQLLKGGRFQRASVILIYKTSQKAK